MCTPSTMSAAQYCCCPQAETAQAFPPAMDESLAQKLAQIEHKLQVCTHERLEWSHPVSV